jgi:hypothetical protein
VGGVAQKLILHPDGSEESVDLTPEEEAVKAASEAADQAHRLAGQFEANEDNERLRVINERARTDPAYAALADIVLKGRGQ